jgi:hypothetical protein
MHPRLWRLVVSVSLRLFCGVTVPLAGHASLVLWLAAFVIATLIPAPGRRRDSVERRR